MKRHKLLPLWLGLAALPGVSHAAINVSGTVTYTQDFDTLPTGAARAEFSWTDDTTIQGFYLHRSNSPVAPQTNLAGALTTAAARPYISDGSEVSTAAPNFHGFLSLGAYSATERCLGYSPTTTDGATNWSGGTLSIVAILTNTGATSTDLTNISYDIEAWRANSAAANAETITLTTKTGTAAALLADLGTRTASATFTQTGWTTVPISGGGNFDFTSADGFTTPPVPSSTTRSGALQNRIRLAPGQSVALRWGNVNETGADAQVGIDNLSLTFAEVNASVTPVVSGTARDPGVSATDPTDDIMSFTLTVDGSGAVGAGWTITSGPLTGTTGTYGSPANLSVPIGSFPTTPPHTLSILVEDQVTSSVNATATVTAPWTTITGSVANFAYDEAGTPDDATDDYVFYEASATGTYRGTNYTVTDASGPQSTPYGDSTFLAIDATVAPIGTPVTLTFSDDAYPTVTSPLIVNPPAIIGVNNASGTPANLFSLPVTGDRRWTFDGTTRVSTQTAATQVDHVVDSDIVDLTALPAVQVTATLEAIGGASSGFEAADRFQMQLIIDGGTPVSMLGAADTNGNGRLDGNGELPAAANTTTTFNFTGVVPASVDSLQIRFIGNSNSPNETFVVKDLLIDTAAPTLVTSVGTVTLANQGTVNPADDMLRAPVTITPINLAGSTGWTSALIAPEGPASGLYSLANPVSFDVLPATAPRTVTLTDTVSTLTSDFTVNAPAQTLTATLVAGSIVRNPDSTVSFQVNINPGNIGPAFSATVPAQILEEPNPTTVTGSGPYTPGTPVTLTLVNPPSSGNVVVNIADVSYPTAPAPVNVTVAVPVTTTYVVGKKDFGAGLENVLSGAVTAAEWINYPALPSMVMTAGVAADRIVETEEVDLTAVDTVAFTAKFRAHEVSTGSNFETTDRFKAELVYSIGGVPQLPISLVSTLDTGAGAPSTTGTGEPGLPNGYMNGYQGAAGTQVLPPNAVYANAAADYNANAARDEFNAGGQPVADKISNTFTLSGSVPAAADGVKLVIYGAGVAGSEGFALTDVLFFLGAADTDGDGMDDAYELANGLNPNDPGDKFLDLDNDGQSNYAEFLAGTAANDPASQLAIVTSSLDGTTLAYSVTWTSVPGKNYRIQGSPNLVTWVDLTPNIPASAGATTTNSGTLPLLNANHAFFQIRVVP